FIVQYRHDVDAVNYFYGPMPPEGDHLRTAASPEQLQRLLELDHSHLKKLADFPYSKLNTSGQVDYILLKRMIETDITELKKKVESYERLDDYLPFTTAIFDFEKNRRRGKTIVGQETAILFQQTMERVLKKNKQLELLDSIPNADVEFLSNVIGSLKLRLASCYDFYNGFEPSFHWWADKPYSELISALDGYQRVIERKSDWRVFEDGSDIGGTPIGREKLDIQLQQEMVAYSALDLLRLADQEFAWCRQELLKASREMGYGDDWKAAQEEVKNSYVAVGRQPELIMALYDDAQEFINNHDLMDIPELAQETWGMIMMSPERQLVNPFFTGGREISISYPTDAMSQSQKLMSMRGNNP